jgi:hypothetical protein
MSRPGCFPHLSHTNPYDQPFRSGGEGDRTPDLVNAIHALSQLSYAPQATSPSHFLSPHCPRPRWAPTPQPHSARRPPPSSAGAPCGSARSNATVASRSVSNGDLAARLLADTDDFTREPLNLCVYISRVNRRGLAEILAAGILHDLVGVKAESRRFCRCCTRYRGPSSDSAPGTHGRLRVVSRAAQAR